MSGTLYLVATPIGNLEDITIRAVRVLGDVALIAAEDTRRTATLLRHCGITTRTTSLHAHNEQRKTSALVARLLPAALWPYASLLRLARPIGTCQGLVSPAWPRMVATISSGKRQVRVRDSMLTQLPMPLPCMSTHS